MSATSGFKSVVVVGASGNIGFKTAKSFLEKKWETKILVRPDTKGGDKINELKKLGAETVEGDAANVESLVKAFKGVDVVVSTVSGGGFAIQENILNAVKQAGVKRFVPSEFGVDITRPDVTKIALFGPKLGLRQAIEKSGVEYTYIITGFFLDATFWDWIGFDWPKGEIKVLGDGNAKISLTHTDDFTRLLPEILSNPKSKNATVNIVGDTITWNHAIESFEKATGKTFKKTPFPVTDIKKIIDSDPNPWNTIVPQLQLVLATGNAEVPHPNIQDFVSTVKLTKFDEFVAQVTKH